MKNLITVAADLGASGGKMGKGIFNGDKLMISDIYSFENRPFEAPSALYWDIFGLHKSIVDGIKVYASTDEIASVGIDTWGASYGLLDNHGRLLEPVYHYRDNRTLNSVDEIHKIIDEKSLFQMTGCQCNRTYTLPQLFSYQEQGSRILELASKMLFLPDLLGYFLSGETSTEVTIAGTSALMNASQNNWSFELFEKLSLPTNILTNIVTAGTVKGFLFGDIVNYTGAKNTKLIATTSHDSAAGVVAIPGFGGNKLYISVGTNISMGVECKESIITNDAFECGFKNTSSIEKKIIVYRDFAGFWLMNELQKVWKLEGKNYNFEDLIQLGKNTVSKNVIFDVEAPEFNNAGGDMRVKINNYLKNTDQQLLESDGEFILCVLESITMKIKKYSNLLKSKLNIQYLDVFVINGGSRNELLMQMISDALNTEIKAGLPYATLAGNLLTQLYALGNVKSVEEIRELSKISFKMKSFEPNKCSSFN